jgi:hypothetical protein
VRANRSNLWIYGGLLAAGLYALYRNTARAGVAPSGSAAALDYGPDTSAYTAEALDAMVPGVSFAPSSTQPGILTSTLTAVPATNAWQVAQANNFWATLQPVNPPDSGYITFPSGSQVGAALMTGGNTRMDGAGNYYVEWGNRVYQLGSQDSSGNWPAMLATAG